MTDQEINIEIDKCYAQIEESELRIRKLNELRLLQNPNILIRPKDEVPPQVKEKEQ